MAEPAHDDVCVVVLFQIVRIRVGMPLVMVKVNADYTYAVTLKPSDERLEILDPLSYVPYLSRI